MVSVARGALAVKDFSTKKEQGDLPYRQTAPPVLRLAPD